MDSNQPEQSNKKKISLQEAIKEQLANKKNKQKNNKSNTNSLGNPKQMKSQKAKQTAMTRRKMGG
ncbi:hypothetical protein ACM26V_14485 [Salipaludibacillus sp. HK11]|uniref:hypothetical protein n=1 Tax=Salipaludibacillus sp. HK11 TaxID=3394320 RepID=UPI0039FC6FE9